MEFLRSESRPKVLRTRLYGDQEFTRFELELLHTPLLQRLYNLKQLGLTDRIYPDAVHSRFNHILGTVETTRRMADRLVSWLKVHKDEVFAFASTHVSADVPTQEATIKGGALATHLESRIWPLRLMGLLHDLTHAAFGHTLEDEVNVFDEKHDDPARQMRFFNALVSQLIYLWCTEERIRSFDASVMEEFSRLQVTPDRKREKGFAEELAEHLSADDRHTLATRLRELELAFRLLLRIEFVHQSKHTPEPQPESLLVTEVSSIMDSSVPALELILHRDMFMVDLVGNTICADLLDYARRDAENAGLRLGFDDRFLRYLCVVSVRDNLSPTEARCIRTAVQIFTDKMRYDVLSEVSGILKARYVINERVLLHPTKCAAGAMVGTAVQLLGFRDLPGWMQVLGDQEFLRTLIAIAGSIETLCSRLNIQSALPKQQPWADLARTCWSAAPDMADILCKTVEWIIPAARHSETLSAIDIATLLGRGQGARGVLWRLCSRRFPKLAYRLRVAQHSGGASDQTIADTYCLPKARYTLERRIEDLCCLPVGSVFIRCPRRKTSMKVAEALVVGADLGRVAQLRNVTQVSPEGLKPFEEEILAIEEMYRSIWQFHAFLDLAHWNKQPVVEWALEKELGFPNDRLLTQELAHEPRGAYSLLAGELRDEIAPKWLPKVIDRVDAEMSAMRARHEDQVLPDRLRAIIREVQGEDRDSSGNQLGLPGIGSKS